MPAPTRAEGAPFLAFCGRLGLGRRQQKTDAGGTVHSFVFDGNQPYTEFTPGFTRQAGGFYTYANGTTYFNRADNLTMPRLSTDYNGTVQRKEGVLMGPYGDNFTETLSTLDFTGFAGGFWDSENNGEHFGAREYQNTHGSWLSPDPAGLAAVDITNPQTWNRYAYVGNNPVSHIDPLGLFLMDCSWEDCYGGMTGAGSPGYMDFAPQNIFNTTGLGSNAWAYCPQCKPGDLIDANGNISRWIIPTYGRDCDNWGCGPMYLKHSGGWENGGTAQAANNERNSWITFATDVAGLVGIVAPKATEKLHLGSAAALASIWNDPSGTNIAINLLGLVKGFDAPMAITGAFNDYLDWGIHNSNGGLDNGANVLPTAVCDGNSCMANPELDACGLMCD